MEFTQMQFYLKPISILKKFKSQAIFQALMMQVLEIQWEYI